ncbi:MAG: hypothetical protein SFU98_09980 [Leptospiraceae bacterium]|nr:hypothetical protein [Leptospiraceae bacterium]
MSELKKALMFFQLEESYTFEELTKKFRELAFKYHPDRGEFTSETMFQELMNYKSILEENLLNPIQKEIKSKPRKKTDQSYEIYSKAKKLENETILGYFKARKKMPLVVLSQSDNPDLIELRKKLELCKLLYEKLIKEFPNSIWKMDAQDSLSNLSVWWNE